MGDVDSDGNPVELTDDEKEGDGELGDESVDAGRIETGKDVKPEVKEELKEYEAEHPESATAAPKGKAVSAKKTPAKKTPAKKGKGKAGAADAPNTEEAAETMEGGDTTETAAEAPATPAKKSRARKPILKAETA